MMLAAAAIAAVLLYLVPIAVVATTRSRRDRPVWAYALDIPLAVALDLGGVLVLARFVSLEYAVFVARFVWLAAGALRFRALRSDPSFGLSNAFDRGTIVIAAVASAVATYASLFLSRPYAIWDRYWHFPLVSSITSQSLPFTNVFQPREPLHYHFAGNVLAGELQALSFRVLHASHALSIAHDLVFALIGASLALLFVAHGYRKVLPTTLATLAVLFAGPFWFFRGELGKRYEGYSYLNFFEMSYRPHISLSGLLLVGVVGAVVVRLKGGNDRAEIGDTLPPLVASLVLLGITDEASTALLGVAVGLAWLVDPDVIHPRRAVGLGVLVLTLGLILATNVLFGASLAPGGPLQSLAWVPARAPGFYNEGPRPLSSSDGAKALAFDVAALAVIGMGFVVPCLRARTRSALSLLAFLGGVGGVAVVLLTHIEINGQALESHRFMTAPMFVFPMVALLYYRTAPQESFVRFAFVLATALPAFGTVLWIGEWCTRYCPKRLHFGRQDFYATDCRSAVGAHLGDTARPTYVTQQLLGLYTGCRPVYIPGGEPTYWAKLETGGPYSGLPALRELDRDMLAPGAALRAACEPGGGDDPVCRHALARGRCRPAGSAVVLCDLSADDRRAMLGAAP